MTLAFVLFICSSVIVCTEVMRDYGAGVTASLIPMGLIPILVLFVISYTKGSVGCSLL